MFCRAVWGVAPPASDGGGAVTAGRYSELFRRAGEFFVPATCDREADVWFHPGAYGDGVEKIAREAKAAGKPLIVLLNGDDASASELSHGVVYRESAFGSKLRGHERVRPALVDDPLQAAGGRELAVRAWSEVPRVGFCGYTGRAAMSAVYRVMGKREKTVGLELRRRSLGILKKAERRGVVKTDFITRTQFWGGSMGLNRRRVEALVGKVTGKPPQAAVTDFQRQKQVYGEFVENLVGNDYTLAARGAGNFSYRFYEALAAGRIPILVDTDVKLPFEDQIEWGRHIVVVPEGELGTMGERVRAFHEKLGREGFGRVQRENRQIWEMFCSPLGFHVEAVRGAIAGAWCG